MSGSGEPGIYWTNNKDWGTNPCCEIALKPYSFCNLCEVNVSDIQSQEELNNRVSVAAFFGTLQAGFTDFHYLRSIWKKTTEEDALIGVGMTGIASGKVLNLNLTEAANQVKLVNEKIANLIGINVAARTTTIKPSGTTSCVLGTSSGIHAWHNDYYLRRIRVMKNDPLYTYMYMYHNEMIEDDKLKSHDTAIITIPQEAPQGSILRTESALELLERINKFNLEWVKQGHNRGDNTNNVSATVSILKENIYFDDKNIIEVPEENKKWVESKNIMNEWQMVSKWMWNNKYSYNGISVLPYDGGNYIQPPFSDSDKKEFEELSKNLKDIDLSKVIEDDDFTDMKGEIACGANGCEIR